jgi:hypothetical protein
MRADRRVLAGGALAALLAPGYLLLPPLGTDLSAQVARADFVRGYGATPVDLRWYGGTVQYGYSLVSPAVMALLGARLTGALALVASAVLLALLLVRAGAPRPALGGLVGAACLAGNLLSGRVTYALGVAFGLAALLALTAAAPRVRLIGAAAGGLLAAATSPVAGLFTGLAAVALLASGRRGGARGGALALAGGSALGLAATALLGGAGGWMNISRSDAVHATVTSLVVAALVPVRPVRVGALLSALGVAAAYAVHTPVGLNATRLATMFALPVVAAYLPVGFPARARPAWRAVVLALVLAALAGWQPPVLLGDLRDAGNPTADRGYFAPLLDELARRAPVGRVEVPPTRDYWESAYVARAVPLARGWLRQVDLADNRVFFDGTLDGSTYRRWLYDNGVSYVALPDAEPSWVGRREAELVRAGAPYLTEVWRGAHWVLYEVDGSPSIVDGAALVSATADAVTLDAAGAGEVLVRVRWSRWLTVRGPAGARLVAGPGRWTTLRAPRAGRYVVTS